MSSRPVNQRFSPPERRAAVKACASTLFAFVFGVDAPVRAQPRRRGNGAGKASARREERAPT